MDSKTLHVLEHDKILERLSHFCDFSASMELAHALQPSNNFDEVTRLLAETTEARYLLSTHDLSIGGSHDIRPSADLAARGGVIDAQPLLEIKSTLIACRDLKKSLARAEEKAPHLAQLAVGLPEPFGIIDAISRVLSERGEVLDSASEKLASIRREVRVARDRLMSRLQKYLTDSGNKLQEPIITQRDGRYVIPLRAEFKGQIKAIIHDQSSSGATLFVEPLPVVDLNNQVRELELAERDEERRILAELSALIGAHAVELKYGMENLAVLDLAFAKAKYAEEIHAAEPIMHKMDHGEWRMDQAATMNQPALTILLRQARHPLLDPNTVVPIDLNPKAGTRALVITGPNTGGKTVSLKTVGLLALMAQSGLHIPAQSGSELPCFHEVLADIGDEQSIEQSLSTFSSHITNIIRILKKADARSLVILDELGAGTDPQEGAALARAILSHLIERGITTFVATHYPELKTFAHSTQGVVNASLEFDVQTLRPTYHLTIGLPGRSNALAIAQRLGLDPPLVAAAKSEINPDDLRADKLLDDIRKERNRTSHEREKLEKSRAKLESQTRELEKRLEKIEDERREVLAKARAEGELEVAVLKQNIESLKQQLKKARQPLQAIQALEEKLETIEEKTQAPVERKSSRLSVSRDQVLKLGEKVLVASLKSEGIVTALSESEAEVQIGTLRVRAKFSDLEKPSALMDQPKRKVPDENQELEILAPDARAGVESRKSSITKSPGMEISLRGKLVEDGLDELDKYLEKAYSAGLPFVRIVHGKGTGKMREAVRTALKDSPYVKSFEEAHENEGGAGVTIAMMAH
ncbi:MAG TPA: endonuclease MutS2 [Anaerolineales bacterium]|nr:endonuclease MutS2 [Anaerolineales bacterium]